MIRVGEPGAFRVSYTARVAARGAGYLHKSGSPAIKVRVSGALAASGKEFEAIIDTGFTGFLFYATR